MPGGSSSRRQRPGAQEPPPPHGETGSASLFTPAYRVSHAAAGTRPVSAGGSGAAGDLPGSGYGWADPGAGQSGIGYQPPGYDAGSGTPAWPDEDLGAGYSWAADDQAAGGDPWPGAGLPGRTSAPPPVSNAVRGFPPIPGESLPVYPPGPFAAWNRSASDRGGAERSGREGGPRAGGYPGSVSQLATATITPDEFDTNHSLPAIKDPIPDKTEGPGKSGKSGKTGTTADRRRPVADPGGGQPRAPQAGRRARAPQAGRRAEGNGPAPARSRTRARKKRLPVWLAIGAACVIIAAVAVILIKTSFDSGSAAGPQPTSTPGPATTSPTPPAGRWEYIGSRKTDSVPLTASELFPATISNAGTSYSRARQATSAKCRAALIGSALQAAVRQGGCTQALRATYLSKTARVMATIGVLNLKNAALASKAAAKAGRFEFVAQLAAKSGPASAIGQGTGIEEALVKGHYLVLVWAEATDLSAPTGRTGHRLEAFMKLLVKHTVNNSLSYRMVDGKPLSPG